MSTNKEKLEQIKESRKELNCIHHYNNVILIIIAEESIKANEQLYDMKRTLGSIELMIRQRK